METKQKLHMTIETPCRIGDVECILRTVSDCGGHTDAVVYTDGDKICVEYNED